MAHGYKKRDLISKILNYYKIPNSNLYCGHHGLSNLFKDLFGLIGNQGKKKFKRTHMTAERERNPTRFEAMSVTNTRMKFHARNKRKLLVDTLIWHWLKLWVGLELPPAPFTHLSQYKCHNSAVMVGSVGAYLILQLKLPATYQQLFVDYMYALQHTQRKYHKVPLSSPPPPTPPTSPASPAGYKYTHAKSHIGG
jgi:hypothetical protein